MKYVTYNIIIFTLIIAFAINVLAKDEIDVEYDIDGNVVNLNCDFSQSEPRIVIKILSVTGGSGTYSITPIIEGGVSKTNLTKGEGFSYFFSTKDQDKQTIGFTIEDETGNTYKMDISLIAQLEVVNIYQACNCNNELSIVIKPGDLNETLSCGLNTQGEPAFFIEVLDITGGVANANFTIETLGLGEISTNKLTKPPFRFYYAVTQNDINRNQPLGFKISDEHSCFYEQTFTVPNSIETACNIDCYIAGKVGLDENKAIQFGCDLVENELIAHFNYNNIKGGNGNFIYEAMVGNITNAITTEPGTFTYSFKPVDFATGQLDFFIKDTAINCVTIVDITKLITAFPYEACKLCEYSLVLTKNSSDNINTACDLTGDENRVIVSAYIEANNDLPISINAFVGELTNTQVQAGEKFQYRFSADDFIDPNFGISLSNIFTQCALVKLNYIPKELFQNCIQVSAEDDLNVLDTHINVVQHLDLQTITIKWDTNITIQQIRLINLHGQLIQSYKTNNVSQQQQLLLMNQSPGLYILQVQTQQGIFKKKLALLN